VCAVELQDYSGCGCAWNFLIPKRAKFPVPAVVALHDHGGFIAAKGRAG